MNLSKFLIGTTLSGLIGGGLFFIGSALSPHMKGIEKIPGYIAMIQKRRSDPMATNEDLKKVLDETPTGLQGLAEVAKAKPKAAEPPPAASLPAGLDLDENVVHGDPNQLQGQIQGQLQKQKEKEQVVIIDGKDFADPSAEDKINQMNISGELKEEILRTYRRTGILPSIQEPGRAPAANDQAQAPTN